MANSTSVNLEPSALKNKVSLNRLVPPKTLSSFNLTEHDPQDIAQIQLHLNTAYQKQMRQERPPQIKQEDISLQDQLNAKMQSRVSLQEMQIKTEPMDSSEVISKTEPFKQNSYPFSSIKQQQPKFPHISKSEEERRIKIERHCLHLEHASYCQESKCVIP